jgi:TPR repeat protein
MKLKGTKLVLVTMLSLAFTPLAAQDFDRGVVAYDTGDYATALQEWQPLAEQGDAQAQFRLGFMYKIGNGVVQDDAEATRWFLLAAEQGYQDAQMKLGLDYAYGLGVVQDDTESTKWYLLAAQQFLLAAERGDASAQSSLGFMYQNGLGVVQDDAEATRWFLLAAEQGSQDAQLGLGYAYSKGNGVLQDHVEALRLYMLSVDLADVDKQYELGQMYQASSSRSYTRMNLPPDNVMAHMWFNIASANGHEDAGESRDDLATNMTTPDIYKAQAMARECMSSSYINCGY